MYTLVCAAFEKLLAFNYEMCSMWTVYILYDCTLSRKAQIS